MCFAGAIESGQGAEIRLYGLGDEGGRLDRVLRTRPKSADEYIDSDELGLVHYRCDSFVVIEGPGQLPGFNGVGCIPQ